MSSDDIANIEVPIFQKLGSRYFWLIASSIMATVRIVVLASPRRIREEDYLILTLNTSHWPGWIRDGFLPLDIIVIVLLAVFWQWFFKNHAQKALERDHTGWSMAGWFLVTTAIVFSMSGIATRGWVLWVDNTIISSLMTVLAVLTLFAIWCVIHLLLGAGRELRDLF